LHLATLISLIVAKRRLRNFFNFEPCIILGRDISAILIVYCMTLLKVSLFIHLSYSLMEQICLTSSMDISHGMIILQTWSKMAHGAITWFCMQLQTAIKHAFMWLAVSRITLMLLSDLKVMWPASTHLCWATFMKSTTSACNPNKVRVWATYCVIREFISDVYDCNNLLHPTLYMSVCHVYHFLYFSCIRKLRFFFWTFTLFFIMIG